MRVSKLFAAVSLLSLVALSATANAATLYVSTSGNDASTGTLAAPLRTITRAASRAKAGDTVEIRGGVYNEVVRITSQGTAAARITFRSYAGERAIIDGTGQAAGTNLFTLSGANYIDVTGLEVRNAKALGINSYNSHHIGIYGNVVHDTVRNGISVGASAGATPATDIVIDGNEVYHTCLENQLHNTTGGWGQAIGAYRANNVRMTNNLIYENDGNGIMFILTDNGYARGNELRDNYSTSFYLDNAQQTVIDGNLVYSSGNTRYYRDGYPAHGIGLSNESYSTTNPLADLTITNNIVLNSRWAFFYNDQENGGGMKRVRVANNTFYGGTAAMLYVDADAHEGSVFENNIFFQNTGGKLDVVAGAGVTYRNNLWYGGVQATAKGAGDLYANPGFVKAGGLRAADYMLTATSPALARALDVTSVVKVDYFGATRVAPLDLGAHQRSSGASDTIPPTTPGRLRTSGGGTTSVTLTWDAATDNVGVTTYTISRNGAVIATVNATSWTDTTVAESVVYTYQVVAVDAAGNRSPASNVVQLAWESRAAETLAAPANVSAQAVGSASVILQWTADSAARTFAIYRDGYRVATVSDRSWTDTSVTAGTTYTYHVVAIDADGNKSGDSVTVQVSTASAGRRRSVRS